MTELGKLLQQTRKKKKYSFEKVHKATRISQKYIKALEESDSSVFPAELYHKSSLKTYAKFLELDVNEVLKLYEQEKNEIQYDLFSNEEIKKDIKKNDLKSISKINNTRENKTNKNKNIKFFQKNYIVKLVSVLVFCILFVGLLIIINIFVSKNILIQTEWNNSVPVVEISDNANEEQEEIIKEPTKQTLDIEALKNTRIKVFADGDQIFEGVLYTGQQQTCFANNTFKIEIGNIENLKLSFNGKPVDISVGAKNDKTNILTFKKDI
jgi:cytoskeletal protein RodZ